MKRRREQQPAPSPPRGKQKTAATGKSSTKDAAADTAADTPKPSRKKGKSKSRSNKNSKVYRYDDDYNNTLLILTNFISILGMVGHKACI